MISNIIEVGDKIDLFTKRQMMSNEDENKNLKIYKSKVYDIIDKIRMKIAMPIEGGKVILLPVYGKYVLDFYTKNGIYQAKGKIIERYKDRNMYVLVVELFSELKKNQRREYYRYHCTIDLTYAIATEKEQELETVKEMEALRGENLYWLEGHISDISGGGIRFISNSLHNKNERVVCRFSLLANQGFKEFMLKGEILSSEKLMNRKKKYQNRMKFLSIKKDETEDIIRFIFEEERRARKNRKS